VKNRNRKDKIELSNYLSNSTREPERERERDADIVLEPNEARGVE